MTAKRAPLAKHLGGPDRDILSTQIDAVRDKLDAHRTHLARVDHGGQRLSERRLCAQFSALGAFGDLVAAQISDPDAEGESTTGASSIFTNPAAGFASIYGCGGLEGNLGFSGGASGYTRVMPIDPTDERLREPQGPDTPIASPTHQLPEPAQRGDGADDEAEAEAPEPLPGG